MRDDASGRRPASSRPSSWTGSSALSLMRPDDERRHVDAREGHVGPGRRCGLLAGRGHDDLARPVPVEHRGQRAGLRAIRRDRPAAPRPGSRRDRHGCRSVLSKKVSRPIASMPCSISGLRKARIYWRGGALRGVVDQALLEDQRMRRVDDDQPGDAVGMAQRRQPGDRAAPVVADQREALELQRVGERDQVLDDPVGLVVLDALGLVGAARSRAGRARRRDGRAARSGATARQVRCDSGKPCSSTIGSPPSGRRLRRSG